MHLVLVRRRRMHHHAAIQMHAMSHSLGIVAIMRLAINKPDKNIAHLLRSGCSQTKAVIRNRESLLDVIHCTRLRSACKSTVFLTATGSSRVSRQKGGLPNL